VVHTVDAFMEALLWTPHLERVVVLPDGVRLLGQAGGLPELARVAAARSRDMRGFLSSLGAEATDLFRGRLWHYGRTGRETEIKRRGSGGKRTLTETVGRFRAQERAGEVPPGAPLYLSELRWQKKVQHPIVSGEMVKTATTCDIYDTTPFARHMPLWERSEGGIFVGERGAGSGMHVDQCLWSNVGRNWCGYKLFALWPWSERHAILEEAGKGTVFHMPRDKQLHVRKLSELRAEIPGATLGPTPRGGAPDRGPPNGAVATRRVVSHSVHSRWPCGFL
ncbi:unnamed protein product, partial [Prorocentrum cordatum]